MVVKSRAIASIAPVKRWKEINDVRTQWRQGSMDVRGCFPFGIGVEVTHARSERKGRSPSVRQRERHVPAAANADAHDLGQTIIIFLIIGERGFGRSNHDVL